MKKVKQIDIQLSGINLQITAEKGTMRFFNNDTMQIYDENGQARFLIHMPLDELDFSELDKVEK